MDEIKKLLDKWARPLIVKWITRGILYGATAWLGLTAEASNEPATQIGCGLGAIATGLLALLIDRLHQKADKAEMPPG